MKHPLLIAATCAVMSFTMPAFAGPDIYPVDVNVGEFCGEWRFTIPGSRDGYGCNGPLGTDQWSAQNCSMDLPEGVFQFQTRMRSGIAELVVDNTGAITHRDSRNPSAMVEVGVRNGSGFVDLNLTTVHFNTNGMNGRYAFEYFNPANLPSGALSDCIGDDVSLPLGAGASLVVGRNIHALVEITDTGEVVVPVDSGLVASGEAESPVITMRTADVTVYPAGDFLWEIQGITGYMNGQPTSPGIVRGALTLRLLASHSYLFRVDNGSITPASTFITVNVACEVTPDITYVDRVGSYFFRSICGPATP